ncbi:AMP-dependent synthetase and ligase [Segniliparus rotundus DSM 44985]|uniref:Acyl-AMP synthetase n=1 Tax=Segniliparus rotundus (strain ATCC BAA-972 / CDC 1076 / CIP 108378 / DSM 44985 / JCM 13578) TaxID=640132 RepID=D6ZD13_SEGRD|nr:long-chain-fatty-acid--AMP ligase FadD32 [Segniliparus rotundus]ADG99200.1 AMP-dependent synthetase and ligase [Segniliparus rotundus DSM 44985]
MISEWHEALDERGRIHLPPDARMQNFVDWTLERAGEKVAYRFMNYSRVREGEATEILWREVGVKVKAIAARLQQVGEPGDRVAILAPQSIEYVLAFFGIGYAGQISVPLFDPEAPGLGERLHLIMGDCHPKTILTTTAGAARARNLFKDVPANQRPRIIAIDAIPDAVGEMYTPVEPDQEDIAYLQYTSGSTRTPAGVEISYRAAMSNVLQMIDAIELSTNTRAITWLPMFHDMGLLHIIIPALVGGEITIMSPAAFVQRPYRWIRLLAEDGTGMKTFAAAPNFAFEHAAARGLPKEGESLDLSNVIGLVNGSEPVQVSSMRKFYNAFAPYGLRKEAIKPSYGMAEATLFVSTTPFDNEARVIYVDREELGAGRVVRVPQTAPGAVPQVSCGKVARSEWAVIVDPETGDEREDNHVGEIWLSGPNIGSGYWNRPEETKATFQNQLGKTLPQGSHSEGTDENDQWMRTGDYGVYVDGELYITGRMKDMIIVDGRNHYPQDIERTAWTANPALRSGYVAAFSVPANELPAVVFDDAHSGISFDKDDRSEQLVIVAERAAGHHKDELQPILDSVRAAVALHHGVTPREILLVPAGSVPRTSSGKIAHRAARKEYLDGTLRRGSRQESFPDAEAKEQQSSAS